jgi:hypothetical protein
VFCAGIEVAVWAAAESSMPRNIAAGIRYLLWFTTSASQIHIGGLADGLLLPVYAMAAGQYWAKGRAQVVSQFEKLSLRG